jgi:hypothetical protein
MVTNLPAFAETDLLRQGCPVTYDQFRKLLSYPTWNYFLQVIRITRAYDKGLTAGIHLLNLNEEYKDRLIQKEYDNHTRLLYGFCLDMLDKLDRWDDFLVAFDWVRKDQRFISRCHKKSLNEEFGDILAKSVVSETKHYIYVHEFWLHLLRERSYRKENPEKGTRSQTWQYVSPHTGRPNPRGSGLSSKVVKGHHHRLAEPKERAIDRK